MGFLQPEDLGKREFGCSGLKELQINRGGVRALRINGYYEHERNVAGETVNNFVSPTTKLVSESDYYVTLNYRGGRDLRYVPSGYPVFHNNVFDFAAGHNPASWGSFRLGYWRGMWYGYFYHYYTFGGTLIAVPVVVVNGNVEVGDRRPAERFVLGNLKVTYNLTDNVFWRIIVQGLRTTG